MRQSRRILQLIITIVISCLPALVLDFDDVLKEFTEIFIFVPGVVFSIFILTNTAKKLSPFQTILMFLFLNAFWIISSFASFATWGFLVPFMGGFSSWFIARYILLPTHKMQELNSFISTGFLSSLLGLLIFYLLVNTTGYFWRSMIGIVAFWQLFVGIKVLKN
jgi:hypothetical protein